MLQHSKIIRGRDEWELKAVQRAEEIGQHRKAQRRYRQKIAQLQSEIRALEQTAEVRKRTGTSLFTMIHGRDRAAVLAQVDRFKETCGLQAVNSAALFSRRRFKQRGARYGAFRGRPTEGCDLARGEAPGSNATGSAPQAPTIQRELHT